MHPSTARARALLARIDAKCDDWAADAAEREHDRLNGLQPAREWRVPEKRQVPDARFENLKAELRAELRAFVIEQIDALRQELQAYALEAAEIVADEAGGHVGRIDKRLDKIESALFEKAVKSK
jgi:hypothetical protein